MKMNDGQQNEEGRDLYQVLNRSPDVGTYANSFRAFCTPIGIIYVFI
jgi:hypothetical protein